MTAPPAELPTTTPLAPSGIHPDRSRGRAIAAALIAAGVIAVLGRAIGAADADVSVDPSMAAMAIALTLLGALLVTHRPTHPVSWCFTAAGIAAAAAVVGASYSAAPALAWLSQWTPAVVYGLLPIALLRFPDGYLPGRRWGGVEAAAVAAALVCAGGVAIAAAAEPRLLDMVGEGAPPPLPAWARVGLWGAAIGLLGIAASTIASVAGIVVRWRRRDPATHGQLATLGAAAAVVVVALVLDAAGLPWTWLPAAVALPIGAGAAILVHGLYDIDLWLDRTLVYGGLTAAIVATYVVVVTAASRLLPASLGSTASVVATAVVALTVLPLRSGLQRVVDRLVYGDARDPYRAVSRASADVALADPTEVLPTMVAAVCDVLRVPYAAIVLGRDDATAVVVEAGRLVTTPERFPLTSQGRRLGELRVAPRSPGRPFTPSERRLVVDLARQAAAAAHALQLNAELQAARERLVVGREEERARLRRDLHDGLGPALAGVTMQVGAARAELAAHSPVAAALERMERHLTACVGEVRRVVDGLRPPTLDDLGLDGALREQLHAVTDPAGIDLTLSLGPLPALPAAVEVAVYRIATEAVTNVARHARARSCRVRIGAGDAVTIEVVDDGVGIAGPRDGGVGLGSMRERAEELGGRLDLLQRAGGGTVVRATIPVVPR